jgi:hypothetical protein
MIMAKCHKNRKLKINKFYNTKNNKTMTATISYADITNELLNNITRTPDKLYSSRGSQNAFESAKVYNKKTNKPLYVSTPIIYTYGATEPKNDNNDDVALEDFEKSKSEYPKLNMTLQFATGEYAEKYPEQNIFLDKMHLLGDHITNDCIENKWQKKWNKMFDAEDDIEILTEKKLAKNKAKKIVRFPSQKDAKGNILKGKPDSTKPRINLKIPFKYVGNKIVGYDIKIYDENVKDEQGKLIPVYPNDNGQTPDQLITKGNIQATFETKVYVMDGKIGIQCSLVQCKLLGGNKVDSSAEDLECQFDSGEQTETTSKPVFKNDDEDEMLKFLENTTPVQIQQPTPVVEQPKPIEVPPPPKIDEVEQKEQETEIKEEPPKEQIKEPVLKKTTAKKIIKKG